MLAFTIEKSDFCDLPSQGTAPLVAGSEEDTFFWQGVKSTPPTHQYLLRQVCTGYLTSLRTCAKVGTHVAVVSEIDKGSMVNGRMCHPDWEWRVPTVLSAVENGALASMYLP